MTGDQLLHVPENERSKSFLPYQNRRSSYTERGYYTEQIKRAWKFFDKKNILFIKYDDFCNNPQKIFHLIFEFLNITQVEIKAVFQWSKARTPVQVIGSEELTREV